MGYKESIYEMLVWEYLELVKGYFVKMDERYKRCGEGDIDEIAVRIEDRKNNGCYCGGELFR